jgi:mRNA-degrading endonuclease RelE of RelBE toxin-antitoxin system
MPRRAAGSWSIEFTRSAFKEFMRIDSAVRERIAESLEWLSEHPRSTVLDTKKLHAPVPVFRLRVADRVVYELKNDRLLILVVRVKDRSRVYRGL